LGSDEQFFGGDAEIRILGDFYGVVAKTSTPETVEM
jgi:hypothetical protein